VGDRRGILRKAQEFGSHRDAQIEIRNAFGGGAAMGEEIIGKVMDYFGKIGVAGIQVTVGSLNVGDTIRITGHTTNLTQVVESIQLEHQSVQRAEPGQTVGIRIKDKVRKGDSVVKVTP
jgi:translation initiation factor IF-2